MREGTLHLVKANDDVISHCKCAIAPIGAPSQLDCPWCGCGWLFNCSQCGKPFTFARADQIEEPIEQIARRDLVRRWGEQPSPEDVGEWLKFMGILQKGIQSGKLYVYLDGFCLPADCEAIAFDGWAASHEFGHLPHVDALKDMGALDLTIGSRRYWQIRAVEHPE